jgi:hypothetical protein
VSDDGLERDRGGIKREREEKIVKYFINYIARI